MNYLIIGGVAGGATAAARIRRNDEQASIVLVERGPYISFANCGLPYHLSGTIAKREQLLVTSEEAFSRRYAVQVKSLTEAIAIDRAHKVVRLRNLASAEEFDAPYDKLLLSPGAEPIKPALPGLNGSRVFSLRNLPDLERIMAFMTEHQPRRAVVVGAGFIGIEVAENLHQRGLQTTLVEGADQILAPLDPEMAAMVQAQLREQQLELCLSDRIERVEERHGGCVVFLHSGKQLEADLVILAIGVRPETTLARAAGLELGSTGGIRVNAYMQTSDSDIYAVGDAVEVQQTVSRQPALIPLAGPANRQGRMAADNMVFGQRTPYRGTQGTAIIKAFDYAAAATGLNGKQLKALGIEHLATITHSYAHASYYPGAQPLSIKLLYTPDGQLLGAQAVGRDGADKRIDVIATAMYAGLHVDDLAELELAYAPPFGAAKDPVNVAAHVAQNVLDGHQQIIDWATLRDLPADSLQLVDVRTAAEFALGSIPGARHIELDTLRVQLASLDTEKPVVVFCQVGLRGYLAARILLQHGFCQVKNLSGGYQTWSVAIGQQA
jgi:NADPH-dependent 2,4-dienoyl-CoA reductase/sulfur reductase-like enzyme/rhodanese-related sulfurtransferase